MQVSKALLKLHQLQSNLSLVFAFVSRDLHNYGFKGSLVINGAGSPGTSKQEACWGKSTFLLVKKSICNQVLTQKLLSYLMVIDLLEP